MTEPARTSPAVGGNQIKAKAGGPKWAAHVVSSFGVISDGGQEAITVQRSDNAVNGGAS